MGWLGSTIPHDQLFIHFPSNNLTMLDISPLTLNHKKAYLEAYTDANTGAVFSTLFPFTLPDHYSNIKKDNAHKKKGSLHCLSSIMPLGHLNMWNMLSSSGMSQPMGCVSS